MSLVLFDGFDHLTSSQMTRRYDTFSGSTTSSTRFSFGQGVFFTASTQGLEKIIATNQSWRIGFAFQYTAYGSSAILVALKDGATTQCSLRLIERQLVVANAAGSSVGFSEGLKMNAWYHIEWYQVIADSISTGNSQVRINEVSAITLNSGDFKSSGSASADRFAIAGGTNTTVVIDDLYVFHDSVTGTPSWTGDARVTTLAPSGDGNYSAFVGSDSNSINNYLLVDDAQPNDDTDYVQSSVAGDRDSYAITNLGTSPASVIAVQIAADVKKDDAGARTGKLFFRISGTDYDGSAFSPTTSYTDQVHLRETSPATSSAWTESEINALEAGIKVES
jgi:hypothetical protein